MFFKIILRNTYHLYWPQKAYTKLYFVMYTLNQTNLAKGVGSIEFLCESFHVHNSKWIDPIQ